MILNQSSENTNQNTELQGHNNLTGSSTIFSEAHFIAVQTLIVQLCTPFLDSLNILTTDKIPKPGMMKLTTATPGTGHTSSCHPPKMTPPPTASNGCAPTYHKSGKEDQVMALNISDKAKYHQRVLQKL